MPKDDKELKMLAKAVSEFAKKELADAVHDNDHYPFGPLPEKLVQKVFDLDFFHILLPEEMEGMGMGVQALATLLDTLCQEDASFGGIVFTTVFGYEMMHAAGSGERVASMTGPGTSPADFLLAVPIYDNPTDKESTLTAIKGNDDYLLSGSVEYVSLGNWAKKGLVPARIEGSQSCSYFLVDLTGKGISLSEPILSLGMRACPGVDVRMDKTPAVLMGEAEKGPHYFASVCDRLHVGTAAMALGVMKGAFAEGFGYASKREQGGRVTVKWSEMQMILSSMALKIQLAELAVAQAARSVDGRINGWQQASLATGIQVCEMACEAVTDGVQVLGGVGYTKDFGQEKRFRDARHIQAFLGTAPMKKLRFIKPFIK